MYVVYPADLVALEEVSQPVQCPLTSELPSVPQEVSKMDIMASGPRHSFVTYLKESLVSVVRVSLGILRLPYIPRTFSING